VQRRTLPSLARDVSIVYTQIDVCEPSNSNQKTTRLAPSPTGALHLGNARTFLINWAIARQRDWRIVLRIEDLDTPRVKPGVIDQTIHTLDWLGMDWDEGPIIQSEHLQSHIHAMNTLAHARRVYPCELSRSEIEAASSAPNEGDHEIRFDPSLRPDVIPSSFHESGTNWRLSVEDGSVQFTDAFMGDQSINPSVNIGDFVVWTRRACPSYQLAVVVDDHTQGITDIVRGNDLLDSTARQITLQRALGYSLTPSYTHLPLVRGADGRRLAKRHGDTRIDFYRENGTSREQLIGLMGFWCGITSDRREMSMNDFLQGFDLDTLPREDITFSNEDDRWLIS
jgi:glutamyl-tRNA synthetase